VRVWGLFVVQGAAHRFASLPQFVGKTPLISSDYESKPSRALQRYYPWLVIGISFLTVGIAFRTRNALAVFLIAVIEDFKWSRGLASGALMLGSVMWTVAAPVIGILLDRFGPRIVLTAGSVIMAIGFVISGSASSIVEF
jgi:Na+/melibiose symporter-like transporter